MARVQAVRGAAAALRRLTARRPAVVLLALAAASAVVLAVFLLREAVVERTPAYFPASDAHAEPPLRIEEIATERDETPPEDPEPPSPLEPAPPCAGCLNEPGALDVAETFLYHMRHDYIDVRTELYSDIAARYQAAGLPPPHATLVPKFPPGLVGGPPKDCSLGLSSLPRVDSPGETWVVWVQEGWLDVEFQILYSVAPPGKTCFPPEARSWPPLKKEEPMLVDARTGRVDSRVMWMLGTRGYEEMRLYGDNAREKAAERAAHWMGKGSPAAEEAG